MKISRCMSTQHPDNAKQPFFATNSVLNGEDEIKEAYYAYSHLNCKEQLWDCEGKEVDSFVVKKLLNKYDDFFKDKELGKDLFLTLRVPNPSVEKVEAKVLLETLESIPRSTDAASIFYEEDVIPIFEIAVPMTTSSKELIRISNYYKKIVVGKESKSLFSGDITISKWIGSFRPKRIKIIPLIETKESMLDSAKIVENFVKAEKIDDYIRVWLARSDPALNYGSVSAVLINKIALQKLYNLQEKLSIEILPIIGCGSAPFRGNFKPTNIDNCLKGYPSIQTHTLQSAFKYDYPEKIVNEAVEKLNSSKRHKPVCLDDEKCTKIIEKVSKEYGKQVRMVAPIVNKLAKFIPYRRMRRLHIGLFGYPREASNIKLPRAIGFCASLYSVGFTPELLGLNVLTQKDIEYIQTIYPNFFNDLKDALMYLNKDNLHYLPTSLTKKLKKSLEITDYLVDERHRLITSKIMKDLKSGNTAAIQEHIVEGAIIRGFLG